MNSISKFNKELLINLGHYNNFVNKTINHCDEYGRTTLINSIISDDYDTFKFIYGKTNDINEIDIFGCTALIYSILNNKGKFFKKDNMSIYMRNPFMNTLLSDNRIDINMSLKHHDNALIYSIRMNNIELASYLLERGAFVNHIGKDGMTSLIHAVIINNEFMFNELIRNRANINIVDKENKTVLMYTCKYGNLEMVNTILRYCSNFNNINDEDESAIEIAYKNNKLDIVLSLINHGCELRDNLMNLSIERNDVKFCNLLIKRDVGRKLDESRFVYRLRIMIRSCIPSLN